MNGYAANVRSLNDRRRKSSVFQCNGPHFEGPAQSERTFAAQVPIKATVPQGGCSEFTGPGVARERWPYLETARQGPLYPVFAVTIFDYALNLAGSKV